MDLCTSSSMQLCNQTSLNFWPKYQQHLNKQRLFPEGGAAPEEKHVVLPNIFWTDSKNLKASIFMTVFFVLHTFIFIALPDWTGAVCVFAPCSKPIKITGSAILNFLPLLVAAPGVKSSTRSRPSRVLDRSP